MGFVGAVLRLLRGGTASPREARLPAWAAAGEWRSWESPRNWIRGEGSRQTAIAQLAGGRTANGRLRPVVVELRREPGNQHDKNAVAAYVDGIRVGYVAREVAATLSPWMKRRKLDRSIRQV